LPNGQQCRAYDRSYIGVIDELSYEIFKPADSPQATYQVIDTGYHSPPSQLPIIAPFEPLENSKVGFLMPAAELTL
jgi:hypothetical protein